MSHENFLIGEIAILVRGVCFPEYDGTEVEVIDTLRERLIWMDRERTRLESHVRYLVRAPDGMQFAPPPERLRKRRPPQDWVKLCNLTDVPREVSHV